MQAYDREIMQALGRSVRVFDWQQSNLSFFNAVEVERNVMFLILTLIILVAAFNIVSSMIMLVKDKGRDIAILRTMGATRGMILRIFMLAGASVGIVGTRRGLRPRRRLRRAYRADPPVRPEHHRHRPVLRRDLFPDRRSRRGSIPTRSGLVLAMAFGLSFLATIYPSWRAARLDPVEALRYE